MKKMIKNNEYKNFINSEDWSSYKGQLIEERGLQCEKCFKSCKRHELHLHHKNYDQQFGKEKDNDMMLLCHECHAEMHQDLEFFDNEKVVGVNGLLHGDWE